MDFNQVEVFMKTEAHTDAPALQPFTVHLQVPTGLKLRGDTTARTGDLSAALYVPTG